MRGQPFLACFVCLNIVFLSLAYGGAKVTDPTPEDQARVDAAVGRARTLEALTALAEVQPFCADLKEESTICTYHLSGRRVLWVTLATALDTTHRITLVCELPTTDAERVPGSCRAYPRHFKASYYYRKRDKKSRAKAVSQFNDAGTLWELIDVVGSGPSICTPTEDTTKRSCIWLLSHHQTGLPLLTLAENIYPPFIKTLVLECVIPTDGADRAEDSCEVRKTR